MTLSKQIQENRNLFVALSLLVVLSNIPYGHYILYPFELFSTWIHELCHGLAALILGGEFRSLHIYSDTSGRAWTAVAPSTWNAVVVASAGYLGTTLLGALMLILQRPSAFSRSVAAGTSILLTVLLFWNVHGLTNWLFFLAWIGFIVTLAFVAKPEQVGRMGVSGMGILLLLSVLYTRGLFSILTVVFLGLTLVFLGMRSSRRGCTLLFSFLAATCGLNALTSIRVLFSARLLVNGQSSPSDAHAVAHALFGPPTFWAGLWLVASSVILGWALYRTLSAPTDAEPQEEPSSLEAFQKRIDAIKIPE